MYERNKQLLVVLLFLALSLNVQAEDVIERGVGIARASGLLELACPLQDGRGLPAYFRYEAKGAEYVAYIATLLPAPFPNVVAWLDKVESYPEWLLVTPNGSPNLHNISFDPKTGKGGVTVGTTERFEGILTRQQGESSWALRIEMMTGGKHVKEAAIEIVAIKPKNCSQGTLVTGRLAWKLDLLARMLGGWEKPIPSFLLLAIRDDLVARSLRAAEKLQVGLKIPVKEKEETFILTAAPPGGQGKKEWPTAGEQLLRVKPAAMRLDEKHRPLLSRLAAMTKQEKKVSVTEFFKLCIDIFSSTHEIVGFDLVTNSTRGVHSYLISLEPGDIAYKVMLEVKERGESTFGVSLSTRE